MSRTTFAVRFKAAAGVAPLTYLTQWRMRLAERALREEGTPVAVLAGKLGYGSESAFSIAFKRVTGNAPRHYRRAGLGGTQGRPIAFPAIAARVRSVGNAS
jgi:AraC-like DNA-binding protein